MGVGAAEVQAAGDGCYNLGSSLTLFARERACSVGLPTCASSCSRAAFAALICARVVQRKNVSLPRRRSRVRVPSLAPEIKA